MAMYVIDINEKTEKGKQLKRLLSGKQPSMKFYSLEDYEAHEENALMKVMAKRQKEEFVDASEIRNTLAKRKKWLSK